MGFREKIEDHKPIALICALVLVVLAVIAMWFRARGQAVNHLAFDAETSAYFTTDDGKTWFVDSSKRIPPFDHNGSEAVRARLFTIDGGKTQFVGYMERYSRDAKKLLESAAGGPPPPAAARGLEVKRPGASVWVNAASTQATEVFDVRKDGKSAARIGPLQ